MKRVLEEMLDDQKPFHKRLIEKVIDVVKAGAAYRKAWNDLEEAKSNLEVAKDPLLAYQNIVLVVAVDVAQGDK
jgi:hypothetical protein